MPNNHQTAQKLVSASAAVLLLAGCTGGPPEGSSKDLNETTITSTNSSRGKMIADIWSDNWFAMHLNGSPLIEDSVPYKTERSFNAERVTFHSKLPMTLAFEFRDFMENDTGLEYIGSRKQQLGDGGAIVQVRDANSKQVISVSDTGWKCLVIHRAPLEESCATLDNPQLGVGQCQAKISQSPTGWTLPDFDDSNWPQATQHSENDVRPKQGYDQVSWSSKAKLIWGPDLKKDNIVLCRVQIRP